MALLRSAVTYPPDILPLMQSLLRTLADIDFDFERDLEAIAESTADQSLKQQAVARLKQRHHERRAPYVQQITALPNRIEATFA